jgi:predicted acylesterase/phospholipase RssA
MPDLIKSREARLGIVMCGGVSLAIYINGVAQKLFRAMEGTGTYKLLKACLDTDIVVDIISDISAGGINGLFLAYALVNGKDFTRTKNLWREPGDFSWLLQRVDLDLCIFGAKTWRLEFQSTPWLRFAICARGIGPAPFLGLHV